MIKSLILDSSRLSEKLYCDQNSGYMSLIRLHEIIKNINTDGTSVFFTQRQKNEKEKKITIQIKKINNSIIRQKINSYKNITIINKIKLIKPIITNQDLIVEHSKDQSSLNFIYDIERVTGETKSKLKASIGKLPYHLDELKHIAENLNINRNQNKAELILAIKKKHLG